MRDIYILTYWSRFTYTIMYMNLWRRSMCKIYQNIKQYFTLIFVWFCLSFDTYKHSETLCQRLQNSYRRTCLNVLRKRSNVDLPSKLDIKKRSFVKGYEGNNRSDHVVTLHKLSCFLVMVSFRFLLHFQSISM